MRYRGVVRVGRKHGSALGFPTINIEMNAAGGENTSGIFAAKVSVGGKEFAAAGYADPSRGLLEAHLFDFDEDLYGREVEIELLEKIRDTEKFPDEAALKAAITDDVAKVREYFKN